MTVNGFCEDVRQHLQATPNVYSIQQQARQLANRDISFRNKCTTYIYVTISTCIVCTIGGYLPYPSKASNVTLPLHPVPPKKIPDAIASLRARFRTLVTRSWNFSVSCGTALKDCTVRRALNDSWATCR